MLGTIESAVFALFGLIVAFTFSETASRFSEKLMRIAEEAHHVATPYFSAALVPSRKEVQFGLAQARLNERVALVQLQHTGKWMAA